MIQGLFSISGKFVLRANLTMSQAELRPNTGHEHFMWLNSIRPTSMVSSMDGPCLVGSSYNQTQVCSHGKSGDEN